MTDLDDRFEAYVFAPKRERIVQKWRVIQCQFVTLFFGNGIRVLLASLKHFRYFFLVLMF